MINMTENNQSSSTNYMFFSNLKAIKRLVDEMLSLDESDVDMILTNGHSWAIDHIATSKDDIEEVYGFLTDRDKEHIVEEKLNTIKSWKDFK